MEPENNQAEKNVPESVLSAVRKILTIFAGNVAMIAQVISNVE